MALSGLKETKYYGFLMRLKDNQKKLLIITAWFFIPLLIAVSWYKILPDSLLPEMTTNHGALLDPAFTLSPFKHQTIAGELFSNIDVEKVWTLVHFVNGDCDEACSRSLYKTRQLRLALGKDIDRLKRIAILNPAGQSDSNLKMWASHPDLTVLINAEQGIGAQIKTMAGKFYTNENALFLIDPLGNVMMHFPATLEPKLIKKDLRKLFKLSHIG